MGCQKFPSSEVYESGQRASEVFAVEQDVFVRETFGDEEAEQDDSVLVERARTGDREAFGELVRRHRAQVFGYARSFTQEPFLAEDIVQDALIRAFLHLGTLVDSRRFLPWLHRIVRNQAYTRLHASKRAKEQVFSVWNPPDADGETDWDDLDSILYRLGRRWSDPAGEAANPEEALVRRELLETIAGMLRCLNPRERRIVESHFFHHLSPQEIARLFQMSPANVYQILSRSRKKLVQEKIRVAVDHYVRNRKDEGRMKRVMLNKPEALSLRTWSSCAMAICGLLEFTERPCSLPIVMGLTGHAFRLNVVPENVHIAGPTMFRFEEVLQQGLRNIGFRTRVVSRMTAVIPGPNANLVSPDLLTPEARLKRQLPELLPEALELIHRSIDKGYPALSWDLFIPEFGLIYGYDDDARELRAGDNCGHDQNIPYDALGRGLLEELFVLVLDEPVETDRRTMLQGALDTALAHYRGEEPGGPLCAHGLAAYDAWRDAFQRGGVEPNGNAYTIAVAQDARRHAALFWQEVADTWTDAVFDAVRPACREASALYGQIAEEYAVLARLFPFPSGGDPNHPEQREHAIRQIDRLRSLEQQAVSLLETMRRHIAR